ncbi:MAG: hypothetical protein ACXACI_17410 [Candidatus Hodarchaeales archaeon]
MPSDNLQLQILEITSENFTPQVYEQYIRFREELLKRHTQRTMALENSETYLVQTKLLKDRGYEFARTAIFGDHHYAYPLAKERTYFMYDVERDDLIGIISLFPKGGDEKDRTWVELGATYRVFSDRAQGSIEDLFLRCENKYLKSHNTSHGIPVARILTQVEPRSLLLNSLQAIGYQITTTTHSFRIPISALSGSLTEDPGLDIRILDLQDVKMTPDVQDNLGKMVDRLTKLLGELEPEDLQETLLKEGIIEEFNRIQQNPEKTLVGGKLLLFFDPSDPVPAGFTVLFLPSGESLLLRLFFVFGPKRAERVKGVFRAVLELISSEISPEGSLMLTLSARDVELGNTLETLGFVLSGVVYDLAKEGPDRQKILFSSYTSHIIGKANI